MFGWEFPPHISGGLGTACFGLTQALANADVQILFVVPKLFGEEAADRTTFISASEVPIPYPVTESEEPLASVEDQSFSHQQKGIEGNRHERAIGSVTRLEIASTLSPYVSAGMNSPFGIEQWNYEFGVKPRSETPQVLASHPGIVGAETEEQEITHRPYPFSGKYGPNLLEEVDRYAAVAAQVAGSHSFDVIHAHDWMTYQAGIEAKRISGKPLIVHVHATEFDRAGENNIDYRIAGIEREGMNAADKVITVSDWTKKIVVKRFGILEEKVEVVHNGILPKPRTDDVKFNPPVGSQIVTFLGRITHQKGPMFFVEAARLVHERFPDVHFVVAGAGDQMPLMLSRIAQLKLSSHFHFTGFLRGKDIDKVWSMTNVYVMPSVSEPFGIAPLEAIQSGVPVIISNQSGVGEVLPQAIKVDFWDSVALADAIGGVLQYKSLASLMKRNGKNEIKKITWDKAAKKIKTLYYDLQKQNRKEE